MNIELNYIQAWRTAYGLTRKRLVERIKEETGLDVTERHISHLETGTRRASLQWIDAVAQSLFLDIQTLLKRPQEVKPREILAQWKARGITPEKAMSCVGNSNKNLLPQLYFDVRNAEQEEDTPIQRTLLPVYQTRPREKGFELLADYKSWTPCPPQLEDMKDAYAISVSSTDMFPRIQTGDVIFATPNIPPRMGQAVIVTRTDGTITLREYVRASHSGTTTLHRYTPRDEDETLKTTDIKSIDPIVLIESF